MTVAAFMELALYDPERGYYARAARRSGRTGDFFTSVDVGSAFGELLAAQIAEMAAQLETPAAGEVLPSERGISSASFAKQSHFDLVEAGAGNGRLSADVLRALKRRNRPVYDSTRLHLVEASAAARAAQRDTLGDDADRLVTSAEELPESFAGVLVANELLDAMPVHQVVMRGVELREIYVAGSDGALATVEGPLSTPALRDYLARAGAALEPGWRAEINLRAVEWIRDAARRLSRGFLILIDYGHEAPELYSASHSAGTLTSFSRHRSAGAESAVDAPPWLVEPGERDITAHVDFTSVRAAAESEGLDTIALLDQTYFLLGVFSSLDADRQSAIDARQLKTLIAPGGLGSTQKVLILGKGVGRPALIGTSFKVRFT